MAKNTQQLIQSLASLSKDELVRRIANQFFLEEDEIEILKQAMAEGSSDVEKLAILYTQLLVASRLEFDDDQTFELGKQLPGSEGFTQHEQELVLGRKKALKEQQERKLKESLAATKAEVTLDDCANAVKDALS